MTRRWLVVPNLPPPSEQLLRSKPVTLSHVRDDRAVREALGHDLELPDGRAYVLADRTVQGRESHVWARAAVAAYRDFQADRIVAEGNQGGDLVETVIRQVDRAVPIRLVRATRGKWVRAEPVAALYAEGRVAHVGRHDALEAQMLTFAADGRVEGKSPDRLDALVWALTELILDAPPRPGVRML